MVGDLAEHRRLRPGDIEANPAPVDVVETRKSAARAGLGRLVVLVVAALVLAHLLMSRVVAEGFRPLFKPRLRWLFRSDSSDTRAESPLPHR